MSTPMTTEHRSPATNPLAEPGIRRALEEFVRRRVPSGEVDDVVQTVLCDALASPARPADPTELRRWLLGVARHKVADHHRRSSREAATELPDLPVGPPPVEARELARWAEEQASATRDVQHAQQTLAWMAREGEGEKLESIAAEEQVPAARVRQRVSRMRRWMRERWLAELAAVAALALLAIVVVRLLRSTRDLPEVAPLPEPLPSAPPREAPSPRDPLDPRDSLDPRDRARSLRAEALRACDEAAWRRCLDQLDEADRIDPAGRGAPDVAAARERALDALRTPTETTPAPGPTLDGKDEKTDRDATDVSPAPQRQNQKKVAPPPSPKSTSLVAPPLSTMTPKPTSNATAPTEKLFSPKKPLPPDLKKSDASEKMDFPSVKR
ncbi:sigma factor [Sorangium sp. So ce291]|uniref:RNA polymerase sigma factor n=1 Tax=Sorangium sp. So ce291 TaxID=3133294 RepID=UPI003F5F6BA7